MEPVAALPDPDTDRAQLETLWAHIPTGVVLVDAQSAQVVRANPRAHELLHEQLGATASGEFSVDGGFRVLHPDGRTVLPDDWPLVRTIGTGEKVVDELIECDFNGARRTLSITSIPVEERGRLVAVLGLFDDVTEQERRERVTRDFLTNAAHELQTPLAAITSAIDVLQAGAKDRPRERDRFLLHIEQSVGRLSRLARALLVLSRAQAQLEPPRTELIELEPFLRGIADAIPRGAIDVRCDSHIAVVANRALLEQAVTNLVDNARKHAGDGVALSGDFADGRATIVVRDTGSGIAAADQQRVFDRFFRSGEHSGFGLGLAIVREVVEVLGGELRLESTSSGTRVSIVLNAALVREK